MFASFLNSIFQSIFIHRSKDFNEDIRLNCLQHLPNFIGFDVVKPIKTEYLKYLGWACNDYSNHVRVAAIRVMHSLIQVLHFLSLYPSSLSNALFASLFPLHRTMSISLICRTLPTTLWTDSLRLRRAT